MKLAHISMVARNVDALAKFYIQAFDCVQRRDRKVLRGAEVDWGIGLTDAEIYSIWLSFPGLDKPFLEILQYKDLIARAEPPVNTPGYGHLSFEVPDIRKTYARVLQHGGSAQGNISNFGTDELPFFLVYMRDPEGNLVELEQRGRMQADTTE